MAKPVNKSGLYGRPVPTGKPPAAPKAPAPAKPAKADPVDARAAAKAREAKEALSLYRNIRRALKD